MIAILLFPLLSGCHGRVSERHAEVYLAELHTWEVEADAARRKMSSETAGYDDIDAKLRKAIGGSRLENQMADSAFRVAYRGTIEKINIWSVELQEANRQSVLFLTETDQWVRNLPVSGLSAKLVERQWMDKVQTQKKLRDQYSTLSTRFKGEVVVPFNELIYKANRQTIAPKPAWRKPVVTQQPPIIP